MVDVDITKTKHSPEFDSKSPYYIISIVNQSICEVNYISNKTSHIKDSGESDWRRRGEAGREQLV